MTNSSTGQLTTEGVSFDVADEPISGQKTIERREDGVVITYAFQSATDVPLSITLSDDLPLSDDIEIGFHPDHAPTSWDVGDEKLTITHRLEPDTDATVALGLANATNHVIAEHLLGQPAVTSVDQVKQSPTDNDRRTVPLNLFERAKQTLSTKLDIDTHTPTNERKQDPHIEDMSTDVGGSTAVETDGPPSNTNGNEPLSDAMRQQNESDGISNDKQSPKSTPNATAHDRDRVIPQLLTELEDDLVTPEEQERLLDALSRTPTRSEEVRLHHMYGRLEEFTPYVDVIDAFLDAEGSPVDCASRIRTHLETVETNIAELTEQVTSNETALQDQQQILASIHESLETFDERLAELESAHATQQSELSSIQDRQQELESTLEDHCENRETELEELRDRIDRFDQFSEALSAVFDKETNAERPDK